MTNAAPAKPRTDHAEELEPDETPVQRQPETDAVDPGFDEAVPSWFTRKLSASNQSQEEADNDVGSSEYVPTPAPEFRSTYIPLTPAQQVEAQLAYRRRLEERFQLAQHMAAEPQAYEQPVQPQQYYEQTSFPQRPVPPRFAQHHGYVAASTPQTAKHALGVSVPTALVLLSIASCIGGLGGYVSANPGVAAQMMPTSLAALWPFGGQDETPKVAATDAATKKDMPAARVDVADVEGAVNAPIPLDISAYPVEPGTPLTLKITGLPNDAYLTKGQQVAQGEWLVRAEDARSAELVVKSSEQPELGLLVTALETKSGAAAAPAKTMKVALNLDAVPAPGLVPPPEPAESAIAETTQIMPVSASPAIDPEQKLPAAVSTPDRFLQEEATSYVEKGEMLLKVGDITAARQFFLRAYELKSADGAYGVARTYDPVVYRKLNVMGLKADSQMAAEWYGKAAAQGHVAAQAALAQPPE
jgi:hypothetical protein